MFFGITIKRFALLLAHLLNRNIRLILDPFILAIYIVTIFTALKFNPVSVTILFKTLNDV